MGKSKKIRDIVYGFIEIDEQETAIVNHPVFQRLRRIKQLAFTNMVYPGAEHTRFEHSLGVMHMATLMYDHIFDKYGDVIARCLNIDRGDFTHIKGRFRKIVRLAALLHDVGHAPFSHSGEELMPLKSKTEHYTHEDYTISIIREKFKDLIEGYYWGLKVDDVTALIDKEEATIKGDIYIFLKQIISSQLDADRADYLLRDSAHIGVSYGSYDMPRLINCLAVVEDKAEDGYFSPVFAVEEKGVHVAESLILARYQMFNAVYFHKVRRVYDYHIREALKEVLPSLGYPDMRFPSPDKTDEYVEIDDWRIYGEIIRAPDDDEHKHCAAIKKRLHYKTVFTTSSPPDDADLAKIETLKSEYSENGVDYFIDEAKTSWYKSGEEIFIKPANKSQAPK